MPDRYITRKEFYAVVAALGVVIAAAVFAFAWLLGSLHAQKTPAPVKMEASRPAPGTPLDVKLDQLYAPIDKKVDVQKP